METQILEFIENRSIQYKTLEQLSDILSSQFRISMPEARGKIQKLISDGYLIKVKSNKIITIKEKGLLRGVISGNYRGFAFFIPDDVNVPDIFIPNKSLNNAMHNDTVLISVLKKGFKSRSNEGRVVSIIQRGIKNLVGTIQHTKNTKYCFVKPDNSKFFKDIYVNKKNMLLSENGQKVVVDIVNYSSKNPEGIITEILGDSSDRAVEILSIIREYNIIEEFSSKINEDVNKIPSEVVNSDVAGRLDLRDKNIFTIDGADAKDLDDAVSIEYNEKTNMYRLGVHIADVAQYVTEGSELNKQAYKRGTSAYFPHLVIPMLPRKLSNGICSLNPKVDRLTLSVFMDIDAKTTMVKDYEIKESVINSKVRFTYDDVYQILQSQSQATKKFAAQVEAIKLMNDLAIKLEKNRQKRGAIDFDLPESKISVKTPELEIEKIYKLDRNESHKLIESFMIAANETVAKHMKEKSIPSIYRVHESPTEDKIHDFMALINNLGFSIDLSKKNKSSDGKLTPKQVQIIVEKVQDTEYKDLINKILLRAMQKAKYDSKSLGHYGLASTDYCHFTSPIRRYPDLVVHRALKKSLRKENLEGVRQFVKDASEIASEKEVAAEQAERDVVDYFKAQYMEDKVGQSFTGKISGVTFRGLFVELENSIEGFVKLESLPGSNYEFNEKRFFVSNNSNKFTIGQELEIKVLSASAVDRTVEFEPII